MTNNPGVLRSILLLLLAFSQTVNAQSKSSGGVTTFVYLSGALSKRFDYELFNTSNFVVADQKAPSGSDNTGFYKIYSDAGVSYKVSPRFSFGASYAYERVHVTAKDHTDENRVFLQAIYRQSIRSATIRYRVKFEDRYIHHALTHITDKSTRLKILTGINVPIRSQKNNLYFSAYEEIYLVTSHNTAYTFSEDRFYMAAGRKLSDKTKFETGILYNPKRLNKTDWYNQYYLQLTLISRLDLFHEKS